VIIPAEKAGGVQSPGRAAIGARTLRTDRWWAYPLTTFTVLLAFVAIVAINGWNRLAVGLRSDLTSLDGLDLPDGAAASGST
jgi:hypothetical protein